MNSLLKQQQDLADQIKKMKSDPRWSDKLKDLLEQAKGSAEKSAFWLEKEKEDQAQSTQQADNMAQAESAGQEAARYLRQALAQEHEESLARQAEIIKRMLESAADWRNAQQKGQADQNDMARRLEDLRKQLDKMGNMEGAKGAEAVKAAAQSAEKAAKQFNQSQGTPQSLDQVMDQLAEAYKASLGELKHLQALHDELETLHSQLKGLDYMLGKDGKKIDPSVLDEWLKEFARRSPVLASELLSELSAGLPAELRQQMQSFGSGGSGKGGLDNMRAKLPDLMRSIEKADTLLLERLKLLAQRDLLQAIGDEEISPAYRDLVNAYFMRLSRETADENREQKIKERNQ